MVKNQKHMKKVGQNTFGSTGQPYLFALPGGGMARVCTKKDTYPDGREFVGYGIKPDIEVVPTLNDYLQNKDATLEKALSYLNRVRERAFGNTTNNFSGAGTALRDAIWNERRLELAMEGDRFFDLVRTGLATTKITGFVAGKHEVFPVPQQEVDISGLSQNTGY